MIKELNKDIINYWNKITTELQEKNKEKFFQNKKEKNPTNN